ncbi:MAG: ABA4-like family protein [Alphaproteobacteria bacterium]|nr:ABA4-like family protein [Alphaproteobacteria bacterium]
MPVGLFGVEWEGWFSIAGTLAMAGWAILILAPRRWPLLNAVPAYGLPAALSGGYAVLVLLYFADASGGYGSLAEVARLFESPPVLLAGWVHYLAFDLFVGAWIARRADAIALSRLIQAPILVATFLVGPLGLVLYLATAGAARRLAPEG